MDRTEAMWAAVQRHVDAFALPGLAVGIARSGEVVARGFGTRDRSTGEPVTADTLFHVASVSKTFVSTAVLQLVESGEVGLDEPVATFLPDLPWADPRSRGISARHLLSHTSGLGDVTDYRWHEPEDDDGALGRFAAEVAGWRLERDPGAAWAYSNAGYELLGHLVATIGGAPFETLVRERVLEPPGMATSTFLRSEVAPGTDAAPHVGLPPRVVPGAYPWTRRHGPSSDLHSSAAELGRWMRAHLSDGAGLLSPETHRLLWQPESEAHGEGWQARMGLGWFLGTHRDHAVVSHSGSDPGFQCNLALVPELDLGLVVLANSNTPVLDLTGTLLDVLAGIDEPDPVPPVTVPVGAALAESGVGSAADLFRRLSAAAPGEFDCDDDWFDQAVWGAIELHRTDVVRPLLDLWHEVRPESVLLWAASGWAAEVDGDLANAVAHLRRAVELDPGNEDATQRLARLTAPD